MTATDPRMSNAALSPTPCPGARFNVPALADELRCNAGLLAEKLAVIQTTLVGATPDPNGGKVEELPHTIEHCMDQALNNQRRAIELVEFISTTINPIP